MENTTTITHEQISVFGDIMVKDGFFQCASQIIYETHRPKNICGYKQCKTKNLSYLSKSTFLEALIGNEIELYKSVFIGNIDDKEFCEKIIGLHNFEIFDSFLDFLNVLKSIVSGDSITNYWHCLIRYWFSIGSDTIDQTIEIQ